MVPVVIEQLGGGLLAARAAPTSEPLLGRLGFAAARGVRDRAELRLGLFMETPRELVEHVEDAVVPASLFRSFWVDVAQRRPDAQVTIGDHQAWADETARLQITQHR